MPLQVQHLLELELLLPNWIVGVIDEDLPAIAIISTGHSSTMLLLNCLMDMVKSFSFSICNVNVFGHNFIFMCLMEYSQLKP